MFPRILFFCLLSFNFFSSTAQVIYFPVDDFSRADSIHAGSLWNEKEDSSTQITLQDGTLVFRSSGLSGPEPTYCNFRFDSFFTTDYNSFSLGWRFHMDLDRDPSGWGLNNYSAGYVLLADQRNFTSTSLKGYAVIWTEENNELRLIRFENGIAGGDNPGTPVINTGIYWDSTPDGINILVEKSDTGTWKLGWKSGPATKNFEPDSSILVFFDTTLLQADSPAWSGPAWSHGISTSSTTRVSFDNIYSGYSLPEVSFSSGNDTIPESSGIYELSVNITNYKDSAGIDIYLSYSDSNTTSGNFDFTYGNDTLIFPQKIVATGEDSTLILKFHIPNNPSCNGNSFIKITIDSAISQSGDITGSENSFSLFIRDVETISQTLFSTSFEDTTEVFFAGSDGRFSSDHYYEGSYSYRLDQGENLSILLNNQDGYSNFTADIRTASPAGIENSDHLAISFYTPDDTAGAQFHESEPDDNFYNRTWNFSTGRTGYAVDEVKKFYGDEENRNGYNRAIIRLSDTSSYIYFSAENRANASGEYFYLDNLEIRADYCGLPPTPEKISLLNRAPDKIKITWEDPAGPKGKNWDGVVIFACRDTPDFPAILNKDATAFSGGNFGEGASHSTAYTLVRTSTQSPHIETVKGFTPDDTFFLAASAYKVISGSDNDLWSGFSELSAVVPTVNSVKSLTAIPGNGQVELSWSNPAGKRASWWDTVIILAGRDTFFTHPSSTAINANSIYGLGDSISGKLLVFSGIDSTVTVSGLDNDTTWNFAAFVLYRDDNSIPYWSEKELTAAYPREINFSWDGGGDGINWEDTLNWLPDGTPGNFSNVVIDNTYVPGAFSITLNSKVKINQLIINPSPGERIKIFIPAVNTYSPALEISATGFPLMIPEGVEIQNSSGLTSGSSIIVKDSIAILNGGTYVHNTRSSNSNLVTRLIIADSTKGGNFIFESPSFSMLISVSGKSFGNLILRGEAGLRALGSTSCNIYGKLAIEDGLNFNTSGYSGDFFLRDSAFINGTWQPGGPIIPSDPAKIIIGELGNIISEDSTGFLRLPENTTFKTNRFSTVKELAAGTGSFTSLTLVPGASTSPLRLSILDSVFFYPDSRDSLLKENVLKKMWAIRTEDTFRLDTLKISWTKASEGKYFIRANSVLTIFQASSGFWQKFIPHYFEEKNGIYTIAAAPGINISGDFYISAGDELSPLPLELLDFYATAAISGVLLQWRSFENLNGEYTIQKLAGQGWKNIGKQPVKQLLGHAVSYAFTDRLPAEPGSTVYYRLMKVAGGKSALSKIISFTSPSAKGKKSCKGIVTSKLDQEKIQRVEIYGLDGKKLFTGKGFTAQNSPAYPALSQPGIVIIFYEDGQIKRCINY